MPKIIKKKPSKKKTPIKEDEVKSAALLAVEKVKERQKHLIIAGGAILAVIVVYIIVSVYSSSASQKASSFEKEAHSYYYGEVGSDVLTEGDRWKTALDLYTKSLEVKRTPTALFYAGNCYYNLNDYENAIKEYTLFVREFSSNTGILPLVYQKLASAYFHLDKNDLALETVGKLGSVERGAFKDSALILEARYYERSGEKDKALEKYREIIAGYSGSAWSAEAGSKVAAAEKKDEAASADTGGDGEPAKNDAASADSEAEEKPMAAAEEKKSE